MSEMPPTRRIPKKLNDETGTKRQNVHEKGLEEADVAEAAPSYMLECPLELPPRAREEWHRIVGELTALGVLSKFDLGPLAVYCGAYALWVDAMEVLRQYGAMLKTRNGHPVQSPYMAIANKQAEIMMRLANEFGFTPAARHRNFSYSKAKSMLLESDEGLPDELADL